jgi:hypothetical protein
MLKLMVLGRRREDVTHDELVRHWQVAHMPAVIKHVQPDGYRVTFFDEGKQVPFDGMATLWFSDAERAKRWYTTADMVTELEDGFFELTDKRPVVLVCEEHVIVDGTPPESAVKVTGLVRRKADADPDTFYQSWLNDHAPNVAETLAEYAGLAEVYYQDKEAAQAHMKRLGPDSFVNYAEPAGFLSGYEVVGIP